MAHRTYEKSIQLENGEVFIVRAKMSKKNAESLFCWLWEAFDLEHSQKNITGTIGLDDERVTIYQTPFTKNEIKDRDKWLKDLTDYGYAISKGLITIENYKEFLEMKNKIVEEHIPVLDERATLDQKNKDEEKREIARKKREEEAKIQNEKDAKEKQKLLKEYPYLLPYDHRGKTSNQAHVAKNIRIELKREFPGHKFSVTSDGYSMGDSVSVAWEDGPSNKEVSKIIEKYQHGRFDGMRDMSYSVGSVFMNLYGSTKHTFANRTTSKESIIKACEHCNVEPVFDQYDNLKVEFADEKDVYRYLNTTSFYEKPKEVEQKKSNSDGEIKVTHNTEKNGVEISFPDKPSEAVRTKLKDNKFRWSRYSKVWYKRYSEESWKFANSLIGQ